MLCYDEQRKLAADALRKERLGDELSRVMEAATEARQKADAAWKLQHRQAEKQRLFLEAEFCDAAAERALVEAKGWLGNEIYIVDFIRFWKFVAEIAPYFGMGKEFNDY